MTDTAPAPSTVLVSSRSTVPAPALTEHGTTAMEIDLRVAKELANSEIVPAVYRGKAANILVAIGLGRSLGLEPAPALYGMHVIEGTPSPSAKLQAALVRRAGHKLRPIETTEEKSVVQIVRADDPDYPITVEFTVDDARRAGYLAVTVEQWTKVEGRNKKMSHPLPDDFPVPCTDDDLKKAGAPAWAKPWMVKRRDNWHTNRKMMLHHRAVTQCVGMACPEVVSGLDFEVTADVDDTVVTVDPVEVLIATPDPAPTMETVVVDAVVVEDQPVAEATESSAGEVADGAGRDAGLPETPSPGPDDTGSPADTPAEPAEPGHVELGDTYTGDDLVEAIKVRGLRQSLAIRHASEVAESLGIPEADRPTTVQQIAKHADVNVRRAVAAWVNAGGEI